MALKFTKEQREELISILDELNDYKLIKEWNDCCEWHGNMEYIVDYMDSLNDLFSGNPLKLVELIDHENFDVNDMYYTYQNGFIISTDTPRNYIDSDDLETIVDYIEQTGDGQYGMWFYTNEIDEFLETVQGASYPFSF